MLYYGFAAVLASVLMIAILVGWLAVGQRVQSGGGWAPHDRLHGAWTLTGLFSGVAFLLVEVLCIIGMGDRLAEDHSSLITVGLFVLAFAAAAVPIVFQTALTSTSAE